MNPAETFQAALSARQEGRFADAEKLCRALLAVSPRDTNALHLLGLIAQEVGKLDVAERILTAAVAAAPHSAELWNSLGVIQGERGNFTEARSATDRAIALQPDYAEAYYNRGNALRALGDLFAAIDDYSRALELKPALLRARNNLGNILSEIGRTDDAAAQFRIILEQDPSFVQAWNNLGNTLHKLGQLDEAEDAFQAAIKLRPDAPEPHDNLAITLKDRGELARSLESQRRAVGLRPGNASWHGALIYTQLFIDGGGSDAYAREIAEWNRRHAAPLRRERRPLARDRDPDRKLRIGYVSPDFREHVIGRNILPLFTHHDRQRFELTCYSEVRHPDRLTQRFRELADRWRETRGCVDAEAARQIEADRIDILVDLTLHMADNRLLVFARKPAPVLVSFAGYPGSTGLETMDYRLTDPWLEPPEKVQPTNREEPFHLLDSFWCYDPEHDEPAANELPALATGRVTFGCLNNFCKVNEQMLRVWATTLRAVPGSRLVLLAKSGRHRQRTVETLADFGVRPEDVAFEDLRPHPEYLRLHHGIDIALDTFPYQGHTTTLDALWMGVPVVSLVGGQPVSRATASILPKVGLTHLATASESAYVEAAIALAQDIPGLGALRSSLRERLRSSPLGDATRFTRGIEAAFREMWRRYCERSLTEG